MQRRVCRTIIILCFSCIFATLLPAQCKVVDATTPYQQDFEVNNGGWLPGGTLSDWAWGTPSKAIITGASSGQKCWITGNLTGTFYNGSERSSLTSPCFDFTNLVNPFIQFKVFWETEYKYDGACFQYSLDNGSSWQNVGGVGEPANCLNANWFNYSNISNLAGLGPNKEGWTGTIQPSSGSCSGGNGSGQWATASHTLSNLAGKPNVLFRFTFGAGTLCNDYDGFAVDDIMVSNAPPNTNVDFVSNCITNRELSFTNLSSPCFNSYVWNFGDIASGTANAATSYNATHTFSAPGFYVITLTATGTVPPAITIAKGVYIIDVNAAITQPVKCFNGSNGALNATTTADPAISGPLQYSWNTTPVIQTATATGLSAGTYILTLAASNACTAKDTITLVNPLQLTHTISIINPSCKSASGSITLNESGGAAPYTYSWLPNVSSGPLAAGLAPGTYTVNIIDNAGCTDVATATVNSLPPPLVHSISITNISCSTATGSAIIVESGGIPPYKYAWLPTGGNAASATGLAVGDYVVNILDSNNCPDSVHLKIINTSTNTVSIGNVVNNKCFGESLGAATATATGVAPVVYKWLPIGGNGVTANNLPADTYTVTATDATGCPATATIQITQPLQITISTTTTLATCDLKNATATALVSGGKQPYQYLWSNGSKSDTANGLGAGTISLNITDANGCVRSSGMVPVQAKSPLKISLGNDTIVCPGTIVRLYPGSFAAYRWQDGSTDSFYAADRTAAYTVLVTDTFGCIANAGVSITFDCQDILFPGAFTPNADHRNDAFGPLGTLSALSNYSLRIFNRWGQMVFATTNPYKKWNGTVASAEGNSQVYIWVAEYNFDNRPRKVVKGAVMLIR